jgi:phosphoadenosine phosphosulfate reductase
MTHADFDLDSANRTLLGLSAEQRLLWAVDAFGDGLFLLSSMQKTASVLMHLFYELGLENEILFVDTGYHFYETLRLRDEIMRRYKLNVVTLYPELTVEAQEERFQKKLFSCQEGQPECCRLRKEEPLLEYLKQKHRPAVAGGLRRADGGERAGLLPLCEDPRTGGYALSPVVDWSDGMVEQYLESHQVPLHPLHRKAYPSIGCYPCTTPVRPGEPTRAGRWRHLRAEETDEGPAYCGINFTDGAGI